MSTQTPSTALNGLETAGTLLPGFVHAVVNHLSVLAGNIELLGYAGTGPEDLARAMILIRSDAERLRDTINRLRTAQQQAFQDADDATPTLPVPVLADHLAGWFQSHGWEVQRARAVDRDSRGVRARVHWLGHVVHTLLSPAVIPGGGTVVFHLSEAGLSGNPAQFKVRMLHDAAATGRPGAGRMETLTVCREVLAALGGTLIAEESASPVAPLVLSLPLLP